MSAAREVHGTHYDYSRVRYITTKDRVEIVCPKHGPFLQQPRKHLLGIRCKWCAVAESAPKAAVKLRLTLAEIQKRGEIAHNGMYTYNYGTYREHQTPFEITCPEHGPFWMRLDGHSKGHGCPECRLGDREMRKVGRLTAGSEWEPFLCEDIAEDEAGEAITVEE